jgi:hypothetical protein
MMKTKFVHLILALGLLLGVAVTPATSALDINTPQTATAEKMVFFAADGMRPDLMERYAAEGDMPTYADLMSSGVTERMACSGIPTQYRRRLVYPPAYPEARLNEQHLPPHRKATSITGRLGASILQADTLTGGWAG